MKKRTIKISYSSLSTFHKCEEKYYRKYVTREKIEHNKMRYLEGNVLQKLFEDFVNLGHYKTKDLDWLLDNLPEYYDDLFASEKCQYRKNENREKCLKSLDKLIKNVYGIFTSKGFFPDWDIRSEVEIEFTLSENSLVYGKVDFIARKDDEVIIVDIKKSRNAFINPMQLVFYAMLFQRKWGTIPTLKFFLAKDNKILTVPCGQSEIDKLMGMCRELEKRVMSTNIRNKTVDRDQCWGCIYRKPCWDTLAYESLIKKAEGVIKIGQVKKT